MQMLTCNYDSRKLVDKKKPVASEVYPGSQRDIFVKTKAKVKTLPVYQDMPIYCPPPPPFFFKEEEKGKRKSC